MGEERGRSREDPRDRRREKDGEVGKTEKHGECCEGLCTDVRS